MTGVSRNFCGFVLLKMNFPSTIMLILLCNKVQRKLLAIHLRPKEHGSLMIMRAVSSPCLAKEVCSEIGVIARTENRKVIG